MIVGIGIDVVDIERFAASLAKTPGLRRRLFTDHERSLPIESLAVRFAAKEALAKALGAPGDLRWHDAEVASLPSGQPVLKVTGTVAARAAALGVRAWHISLTHDTVATAMVIAEGP